MNVLKALCQVERLQLLEALSQGPLPLSALKQAMGKPYSVLLYHLRVLQRAGLVDLIRLKPKLTVAYLKRHVEIHWKCGEKPKVLTKPLPPPAESELVLTYWRLLVRRSTTPPNDGVCR